MERRRVFRDVALPDDRTTDDRLEGRACVAVIGIDRYRDWSTLHSAVNDARRVAQLFTKLGFEQVCAPLINEAPTGDALRRLVTDELLPTGEGGEPNPAVLVQRRYFRGGCYATGTAAIRCRGTPAGDPRPTAW
jgi:hypothetical protein